MTIKKNKMAGFWIRFIARMIDFILFSILSISIAFLMLKKTNEEIWDFKLPIFFYVWAFVSILLLISFFLIPLFFWNRTLGMFVCKIKVIFKSKSKVKLIFLREFIFSIGWILSIIAFMVVINHSLFGKVASYKKHDFSTLENLRLGIVSTISSFIILLQLVFAISIVVRGKKGGIHDQISFTSTVWVNKIEEIEQKVLSKQKGFKPRLVRKEIIEWVK